MKFFLFVNLIFDINPLLNAQWHEQTNGLLHQNYTGCAIDAVDENTGWILTDDGVFHKGELSIDDESSLPYNFKLYQPYPNPFNPTTTIRFSVASTQSSQIQIFDITGRLVETLIDEPLTQGEHEIVWNAGSQPSGVYFVRLQSGEFVENQKVILLK